MKFVILLLVIISAVLGVNAQIEGRMIDVEGTIPDRSNRDPTNRNGGGDRSDNRNSNTKQVTVNGKSFNVSKKTVKDLKSFLAEFKLMQDVGKFVPGNAWDAATKARAENFIKDKIVNAALKNNRGDEKMWETVLDGLRKSGLLDKSAERRIRKEQERKEQERTRKEQEPRKGRGGDNQP